MRDTVIARSQWQRNKQGQVVQPALSVELKLLCYAWSFVRLQGIGVDLPRQSMERNTRTVDTVDQHQEIVSIAIVLLLGCVTWFIVYRGLCLHQAAIQSEV